MAWFVALTLALAGVLGVVKKYLSSQSEVDEHEHKEYRPERSDR